ncbi:MAG: ABC transporter permease subunit [Planctomycetaceae bacterium]|nr:ABC transporter permease subunit [Planctomycetaceae bacterium]
MNAILERELLSLLRSRKAFAIQAAVAILCGLLVLIRWPDGARVDLAGVRSREVFILFGYGLLTAVVLLVPVFPATSIVRERQQKTLVLLIHSPLTPLTIYLGKLVATLGFALVLIALTAPGAAACHAMGGVSLFGEVLPLYGVLIVAAVQFGTLGLYVSSRARSADGALRVTYGLVLLLAVFVLLPHMFLQGSGSLFGQIAEAIRWVSPIPAVMRVVGHGDVGEAANGGVHGPLLYVALALGLSVALATATIRRLNYRMLDRTRSSGIVTDDQASGTRLVRRLLFIVDPQRRKAEIGDSTNPVLVKEFRTRQFGRLHWLLRLVAGCATVSLGLTYATTLGSVGFGAETIGGIMVLMQVALILLLTPGLAGGLISGEHESGGWRLLRLTPLGAGVIVRGKLISVLATMTLILCATLPGYLVMMRINPLMSGQITRVVICLVLAALFAIALSAAVSSLFQRSAAATATAYCLLWLVCAGPLLIWLGRDAPFGHETVSGALQFSPLAAALSAIRAPGFAAYDLTPANWWIMGTATVVLIVILSVRVRVLLRPS